MGTHPIFESDFDCLTDMFRPVKRMIKCTTQLRRKLVVPGDPLYDESLVDFAHQTSSSANQWYSCETIAASRIDAEVEDMTKRINEFECNKTWFRVEGVYPIKVVMRLQNEMAEHFCDKQADHIIETLLVAEDNQQILDELPDHYTDFVEVLIVPKELMQSKQKQRRLLSIPERLNQKGIVGIGKLPKPEVIGFLRNEFIRENGGRLPCGNIRVIVEALRHIENARNVIDVCAINGVHSLHITEGSMNIFAPPIVTISQGNVLSIPIHQHVNYDHFNFIKEFEGVAYPPLMVLLEGDEAKVTPAFFHNLVDDLNHTTDDAQFDQQQIQRVNYTDVDWTYPNIVVVFGETSRGLSKAITRKAVEYDGCLSYIGTSIDLPLSLSTALSATIFEASRANSC